MDFYDTMGGYLNEQQERFITLVLSGIDAEIGVRINRVRPRLFWSQNDGWNCGVGICMIAERFSKDESLLFNNRDVYNWRKHAYDMLKNVVQNLGNFLESF